MRSVTALWRIQRIIATGVDNDLLAHDIAKRVQVETDQQYTEELYRRARMIRGEYVEILMGADKGKVARIERVDGFRVITRIGKEELDQYRFGDLKVVELIMAEGDCVTVLNGAYAGKIGVITLIERQTITVSIKGLEPQPYTRMDLEVVDCPDEDDNLDLPEVIA